MGKTSSANSTRSGGVFDFEKSRNRLDEIESVLAKPGAWDQPEVFTTLLREKSRLEAKLAEWNRLRKAKDDLDDWMVLAEEDQTQEILGEVKDHLETLSSRLQETELATILSGPEDAGPALLEIHPGAGGTEAQDWAEMLLRMYRRWCERHDFKVTILDFLPGDEAGIKSITLQVEGPYAYGLLKGESGIHRLIRISPFDASGRRHTSFASVGVYPDIGQDIEIEVRDEDLKIDVFRASGPGGQHVNRTNSAVRITHLPSGIVAQCQNEKSQLRNKETALKIIKARLYELELKKIEESKRAEYSSKDAIGFGSQIRSYTLQPYRLVKDHRSGAEVGNVDAVLDGDLDELVRDYLLHVHSCRQAASD